MSVDDASLDGMSVNLPEDQSSRETTATPVENAISDSMSVDHSDDQRSEVTAMSVVDEISEASKDDSKTEKKKPNLKLMTDVEKREYYRIKKQEQRDRKKLASTTTSTSKAAAMSVDDVPSETLSSPCVTDVEKETFEASNDDSKAEEKKTKLNLMTDAERKEYHKIKQKEYRDRKKLASTTASTPVLNDSIDSIDSESMNEPKPEEERKTKKRQTTDTTSDDFAIPRTPKKQACTKEPHFEPGGNKSCKVRVGFIDLFDVEACALVVPFYEDSISDIDSDFRKMMRLCSHNAPDNFKEFEDKFQSEWRAKLDNFETHSYYWGYTRDIGLTMNTILVKPPVIKNNKFSIVNETHLRASVLSCLLQADKSTHRSIAFPIMGHGVDHAKSVAITLQTIFAYMGAVKNTNLELIYIVTPSMEIYDELGEYLFYINEFDLKHWTKDNKYFQYESLIFNRFKEDIYYSTIPGTDMIWRCFKLSHPHRKTKESNALMQRIHQLLLKQTGVSNADRFVHYMESARKTLVAGRQEIFNGVSEDEATGGRVTFLPDIRYEMDNFCGSNAVLRKLHLLSNHCIYHQDTSICKIS